MIPQIQYFTFALLNPLIDTDGTLHKLCCSPNYLLLYFYICRRQKHKNGEYKVVSITPFHIFLVQIFVMVIDT